MRAVARINLAALERNANRLSQTVSPAKLCAVVKADGYGHGAVKCAQAALEGGADFLAVACLSEAVQLRSAGIEAPVLILGPLTDQELATAIEIRADIVVWTGQFLDSLSKISTKDAVRVHIKFDTGMGRFGTRESDIATHLVNRTVSDSRLQLVGVMTHFATADDGMGDFLSEQLENFTSWVNQIKDSHPNVLVHAANSGAALSAPATRLDMVRCGISLYGLDPFHQDPSKHGLEPVLELSSYVAAIKRCRRGESIGYGKRYIADSDRWIATLPIGYADGISRAWSNNGFVLISGERYPIVGIVSMDSLMVDLGCGKHSPVETGTPVILIGEYYDSSMISEGNFNGIRISVEEIAARINTINYEVVCGLSKRVTRQYHWDARQGSSSHTHYAQISA